MLAPVLDEIAAELDEKVRVGKVDVDNNLALSNRLGIRDIPTVLIFKSGELKDPVVGLASKADLVCRLNRVKISHHSASVWRIPQYQGVRTQCFLAFLPNETTADVVANLVSAESASDYTILTKGASFLLH
jgi:thioredoxin-like negative regulator of GroEL